jgi:WhiB family transcriptional regulator, redox-sensing transcriptional regulator
VPRPVSGAEPNYKDREALGRSRGGLTSKIHLLADSGCRPLARLTSAGQREQDVRPVQVAGSVPAITAGLDLPCTQDPELFFAESPQDVERAKAMCRGCGVRISCLAGALERREPGGVWGGELLMRGAPVPRKRPRTGVAA